MLVSQDSINSINLSFKQRKDKIFLEEYTLISELQDREKDVFQFLEMMGGLIPNLNFL